jgi:redox-sensing transcriptional repressor
MKVEKISELTTNRLSIYLRCLHELAAADIKTTSSDGLAKKFNLSSAQIRKDLAYFGEFGVRGVGYYVEALRDHITKILGLDRTRKICIVGAGRLGTALADYYGFSKSNFEVVAMFDASAEKIGQRIGNVTVYDLNEISEITLIQGIELAVIAVPADFAQEVLDKVSDAGIKAVLNFAPTPMRHSDTVKVKTVDLTISLESLAFFLAKPTAENDILLKPN